MDRPTNRLVYKITPTAVTAEGDQVDAWSDGYGRQHVIVDSGTITASGSGGVYNSTPPSLTNGQTASIQLDVNGNTKVNEQFAPVYEDNTAGRALVEQRNSYTNITTATTTTIKSGSGFLHLIMVNTAAASATITIYDNTSAAGTKISTITMPAALLASQANFRYDITFNTGLTIVTTGVQDILISWR
jgi:hypothetical protein